MKISIIIPVFNVEKYIEKCINSILCQTYSNWELILIDDRSTDDSRRICKSYADKDNRISVLSSDHLGPGIARNIGVNSASGDWITFIDPDDWVMDNYLERLVEAQLSNDVDIVMCQYYRTIFDSEEIDLLGGSSCDSKFYSHDDIIENLVDYNYMAWGKLFRTSLLKKDNGIIFPDLRLCEDYASIPYFFIIADSVEVISDRLYVWRRRNGSITNQIERIGDRIASLSLLAEKLIKEGVVNDHKALIEYFFYRRIQDNNLIVKKLLTNIFSSFTRGQQKVFCEKFNREIKSINNKLLVFGGYTSYTVAKLLGRLQADEELDDYFGFSSIITLCNRLKKSTLYDDIAGTSGFRKKCIAKELSSKFMHLNKTDFESFDYLIIDFTEERYDIGLDKEGYYYTLSTPFLETSLFHSEDISVLDRNSDEIDDMWRESCDVLIDFLEKVIPANRIILLRSLLSEYYGTAGKEICYEDVYSIRQTNRLLNRYYDYFEKKLPGIMVIRGFEEYDDYYTDGKFRHGVYPWHLNRFAYRHISEIVRKAVFEKQFQNLNSD